MNNMNEFQPWLCKKDKFVIDIYVKYVESIVIDKCNMK